MTDDGLAHLSGEQPPHGRHDRPAGPTEADQPGRTTGAGDHAAVAVRAESALRAQPRRPRPGGLVFTAGDDGKVRAFDAATGAIRWEFATPAPIKMPPTIAEGRAYFGSGDGYVYALEAATGRLLWRFRAAPVERLIMVYGNLALDLAGQHGRAGPRRRGLLRRRDHRLRRHLRLRPGRQDRQDQVAEQHLRAPQPRAPQGR